MSQPASIHVRAAAQQSSRRAWGVPVLLYVVAAIVFHALGYNPFVTLYGAGDSYTAGLPSKIFSTTFSAWNPWVQLGQYTYPNTQFQPFYPPGLILVGLLSDTFGYNLFILAHYVAAGLFCYLFLRNLGLSTFASLFGGLCFELSGFLSAHKGHQAMLSAAVWLPLMLYSVDRFHRTGAIRQLASGAAAVGMSLLAGFPQITLYSLMLTGAYAAYRAAALDNLKYRARLQRFVVGMALMVGVGALISAVQVIPVMASLPQMTRERLTYEMFSEDYFPLYYVFCFLVPNLFGGLYGVVNYATNLNLVELYPYMGLLPLALAAGAVRACRPVFRDTLFWAAVALVAALLALGPVTPLHRLMFAVPGYNLFRAPARHLFEIHFAVCVLAAMAVHSLFDPQHADIRRRLVRTGAVTLVALFGATLALSQVIRAIAGFIATPSGVPFRGARVNGLYSAGDLASHVVRNLGADHRTLILPFGFLLLTLATLAFLFWRPKGNAARAAVLLVTAADLYAVHAYIYLYPDTTLAFHPEQREEIAILKKQGYDPNRERVYTLEPDTLYTSPLLNILSRVSVINDYTPMWLKRYQAFADFYPNGVQPPDRVTDVKFLAVTSTRYLLTRSPEMRRRLATAAMPATSATAGPARTPAIGEWALGDARAEDAGLRLQAPIRDSISLIQTPIQLKPNTTYVIRFDARAEATLDRPMVIDFYDGTAYDSADQDRVVAAIPNTFRPESVLIDSGPNAPPAASLRMYTQSTAAIQIRNVSIAELGSTGASAFRELGTTKDGISVFLNQAGLPRFRFAQRLLPVKDLEEARTAFRSLDFDAASQVTVEGLAKEESLQAGQIVSQTIENTDMRWRVRTPSRSFFVVADSWFPGWQATVDGRPAHIYPVDGFLRGILIEGAGEHDVQMAFRPVNFYIGLLITVAGLVVLWLLWMGGLPGRLRSDRTDPESVPA